MNSPHPPHPPFPPPTFNPGHIQNPGPFSPDHGFRQGGPYKHDKPADKRRSPERGYRHDDHRQKGYSHGSHGDKHKMELFGDRKDRGRSPDRRWRPEGGRHRIEYERGRTPPRHRSRERSRWAEGGWGPDSTGGGVGSELYLFSGSGIAIETAGGPSHLTDTGRDPAGWGHSAGAGGTGTGTVLTSVCSPQSIVQPRPEAEPLGGGAGAPLRVLVCSQQREEEPRPGGGAGARRIPPQEPRGRADLS